jgi:excisionase family DNA binding protein
MANLANNPHFSDEHWMTTADAMAYLKVSRRTIQRWCNDKHILYTSVGGIKYFPKKFLEQMMFKKLNQPLSDNPKP